MAQQIQTHCIDDITGERGAKPIEFGIDGIIYTVDLTDANAERLLSILREFKACARRTDRRYQVRQPGYQRTRREQEERRRSKEESDKIREWARRNGLKVADRGRISNDVLEKYRKGLPPLSAVNAAKVGLAAVVPAPRVQAPVFRRGQA